VSLELVPHPRCQRGLRWTLILPEPAPAQAAITAGLERWFPEAVVGFERWGTRRVDRLIVQFRVEFRVGERPGDIGLLFRSCCAEPDRELIRARLFAGLAEWG